MIGRSATRVHAINPQVAAATLISLTPNESRWGQVVGEMQRAGADLVVITGPFKSVGKRLDAVRRFGEELVAGADVG